MASGIENGRILTFIVSSHSSTAYCHVALYDLCLHTNFTQIGVIGQTLWMDVWTETGFIRPS